MAYVSGIAGLGSSSVPWAATPVRTHSDWSKYAPNARIANGYIIVRNPQKNSEVGIRNRATGRVILHGGSYYFPDTELDTATVIDSNNKLVYSGQGAYITGSTSSASTSATSDYVFGDLLTKISPDPKQTTLRPSDYSDLDKSKPAEKSVFDAIGDVFSGVADAAKSLLPTALAVTKAQQERKQQEQLARLQAAGLLPQQQTSTGMSTTTKVALGAGGALLLGFIIYKVATR